MNQSDTTIILFPYRIDYSIDSHKLIELIEILNVDNNQVDISTITQLLFSFSDHQKGNGFDISIILDSLYRSLFY